MTTDQEWQLLKAFANAHNSSDFPAVQALIESHMHEMTSHHWEILLMAIELTKDFVAAHHEFLGRILSWMREYQQGELDLRSTMRLEILDMLLYPA
jgi:hypothetical protein